MKKIIILPVGFILTNVLYTACCKCPGAVLEHYEVTRVNVNARGSGGIVIDNGMPVTADTVYLNYNFVNQCVAKRTADFSFLVNSAMACKCNECGRGGIKNSITSFKISSDTIFYGIAANQSLNSFFKVQNIYNPSSTYSIDSLTAAVNNNSTTLLGTYTLFTKTKPGNNAGHKFTLTMLFQNGSSVACTTNRIFWQ